MKVEQSRILLSGLVDNDRLKEAREVAAELSSLARKKYYEKLESGGRAYINGPISKLLGMGNVDGYDDFQSGADRDIFQYDEIYQRGYKRAQEMAAKGERPQMVMLREDYPEIHKELKGVCRG